MNTNEGVRLGSLSVMASPRPRHVRLPSLLHRVRWPPLWHSAADPRRPSIRIFEYAGAYQLDLDGVVRERLAYKEMGTPQARGVQRPRCL